MPEHDNQTPDATRALDSAQEIVHGPAPQLYDICFFKVSGERLSPKAPDEPSGSGDDETDEIGIEIKIRSRQSGREIGVRVDFAATHRDWRVDIDVSAEFAAEEPFSTTEAGRLDFADKVGIMTLYPYIRETVGNLTQRIHGVSTILPTIQAGQIPFRRGTDPMADPQPETPTHH